MSSGNEVLAPLVVIWTPVGRDALLIGEVLRRADLRSVPRGSVEEVCQDIRSESAGLTILAEEALTRESIGRLQQALEQQPSWSDLPIILLTGGGTSTGASLNRLRRMRVLGNITLLERPLRSVTLITAVRAALGSRQRQFQTRDRIRELQETQNHLAQANEDLQQFAFAASHDLQEPLRMVNVFTQILLDRHIDPSDQQAREFAGYVRSGVKRMEVLLQDLLLYSKAIHEEQEWPIAKFNLQEAVRDAMESLKVEIETGKALIHIEPLPDVRGNRTQLSLVFQNLISNSIKYARSGVPPRIEVAAEPGRPADEIRVQDNGIGFEQIYAERVFALFQRLSGKDIPGTGLGLAICRRIIERHGGRIWAESQPGIGTTFRFTLPEERKVE